MSKIFYPKNIKLVELNRFAHTYDFHAWSDGVHEFAKTNRLTQKEKKYSLSTSILYWLSVDGAFYFFFIFGEEKKILKFFTATFGLKLHIIIINNY